MAKLERTLHGDFDRILAVIHDGILNGSISATYEDGSDYTREGTRCAVRVYERYSYAGSNRVSLSVTLVGGGGRQFLSAITSGGSQAVFFKINTLGEHAFLDQLEEIIRQFEGEGDWEL